MDDQAEEDLHHEDASSVDSLDSTPTGSVESSRSTASKARQPLFSAAAWRGLVGRVVRHLCIQAIGQCQLDVKGSNTSASAVKAWRRRQWAHLNTAAFRRTTLACTNPRNWNCRIRMILIFNRQAPCKIPQCHRCGLQRVPCSTAGSTMNLDYAIGRTKHCSMLWKRQWQDCPTDETSMPRYDCSRSRAETNGGNSWRRPGGHWRASQAHDLSDSRCTLSSCMLVSCSDIFHVVWHHSVRTCPTPQPEFWSYAWPHGTRGAQCHDFSCTQHVKPPLTHVHVCGATAKGCLINMDGHAVPYPTSQLPATSLATP